MGHSDSSPRFAAGPRVPVHPPRVCWSDRLCDKLYEMSFTLNLSEEDFNRVMEEIDQAMVSEDVKVPARQIRGWMLFCQQQRLEGIDMRHPISQKVMGWFAARYGERLNLDWDFGHSVLLVRGDLFRFRCPVFYGRVLMVCHPELMEQDFSRLAVNQLVVMNVLKQIEGVTPTYARSLTPDERNHLLETFVKAQVRLARVGDAGTQTYVPEARADVRASVEGMMRHEQQFGPSKWASLQAVEKFLKAYISQQGTVPKRNHRVTEHAGAAESLGLRPLERASLNIVQCPPSVRYEASSVTRAEAVKAHQVAISICADIASQLAGRSGWHTGGLARAFLNFDGKTEKIPAVLIARTNQEVGFNQEIEADR